MERKPAYSEAFPIRFAGLKIGAHPFDFEVGPDFLASLGHEDLLRGELNVHVVLHKQTTMMELDTSLAGTVEMPCDRCNEAFALGLDGQQTLYVKFGDAADPDADEIIYISEHDHQLDMAHYIYELINLSLPLRKVHPNDTCDPAVLASLESLIARPETTTTDPRWAALEQLKNT